MDSVRSVSELAFGAEGWNKHIGRVPPAPPLPRGIGDIMAGHCPFFEGKTIAETHALILIPQSVNGIPLTLNKLERLTLTKAPTSIKYTCYKDYVRAAHGETAVIKSYWALVLKHLVPQSVNKSYEEQSRIIHTYSEKAKASYEAPRAIEVTMSIFAEFFQNKKKLYSEAEASASFTRCQETVVHPKFGDTRQVAVGCFDAGAIFIDSSFHREGHRTGANKEFIDGEDADDNADAIGAVRLLTSRS